MRAEMGNKLRSQKGAAALAAAVLLLFLMPIPASAITTDKENYVLGETATIAAQLDEGSKLILTSPSNHTYIYLGTAGPITFIPSEAGLYRLQVKQDDETVDEKEFTVANAIVLPLQPQQNIFAPGSLQKAQSKNEEQQPVQASGVKISTDKAEYALGEKVAISMEGMAQGYEIIIISQSSQYRYLGTAENISYTPQNAGSYALEVRARGILLAKAYFKVTGEKAAPAAITEALPTPPGSLKAQKRQFAASEQPAFELELAQEGETKAGITGSVLGTMLSKSQKQTQKQQGRWESATETITLEVLDASNSRAAITAEIREEQKGRFAITLPMQNERAFRPGRYKLRVNVQKGNQAFVQEQDFIWGVLAINTNKSAYFPDQDAFIGMAVLDDFGKVVCNASVTLAITAPGGSVTTLTTTNGKIKISDQCEFLGITDLPDYYTTYHTARTGTYVMNLTAETQNGARSLIDNFTVQTAAEFDVSRQGPTRIYPAVPYTMSITATASRDYTGTVTEYVPASFSVTRQPGMAVTLLGEANALSWNVDVRAGETFMLSYEFDAPDISPEFYTLGEMSIGSWAEARKWQIASDAIAAGEKGDVKLTAKGCRLESSTIGSGTFTTACAGTYPGNCIAAGDRLSCSDSFVESVSPGNNRWGGVNITSYNSTITDCESVTSVRMCHNWTLSAAQTYSSCRIGTDTLGDLSWATTAVSCPTTTSTQLVCTDVTASETWECNKFFGITTPAAWAMIEAQRTGGGSTPALRFNALYFNVTYVKDTTPPNATVTMPGMNTNTSANSLLVNVSINDTKGVAKANLTLFNSTGNVTGLILMSRGAGTATSGWWNATLSIAELAEGYYNISVNSTDSNGNSGFSANLTVTIDRTAPSVTITLPEGIVYDYSIGVPLNFSASDQSQISSCWYSVNGAATVMIPGCLNTTLNTTGYSSTVIVYANDTVGNTGQASSGQFNTIMNTTLFLNETKDPVEEFELFNFLAYYRVANGSYNGTNNITTANCTRQTVNETSRLNYAYPPVDGIHSTVGHYDAVFVTGIVNSTYGTQYELEIHINKTGDVSDKDLKVWVVENVSAWNSTQNPVLIINGTAFPGITETNQPIEFSIPESVFNTANWVSNYTMIAVCPSCDSANKYFLAEDNDNFGHSYEAGGTGDANWTRFSPKVVEYMLEIKHRYKAIEMFYNPSLDLYQCPGCRLPLSGYRATFTEYTWNGTCSSPGYQTQNRTGTATINVSQNYAPQPNITSITPNPASAGIDNVDVNWTNDYTGLAFGIFESYINLTYASNGTFVQVFQGNPVTISADYLTMPENYTLVAFAGNDRGSNASMANLTVVDKYPPNASIVMPAPGLNVSGSLLINASANDSKSTLPSVNLSLLQPGWIAAGPIPMNLSSGSLRSGHWNVTFNTATVADGLYNLSANATDSSGNTNLSLNVSVLIDNTAPNASMPMFQNNTNTSLSSISIQAEANDTLAGLSLVDVQLRNPGSAGTIQNAGLATGDIHQGTWSVSYLAPAQDGVYNITIIANDTALNQKLRNISTIVIDRARPNATTISPVNNANASATTAIRAEANDSLSGVQNATFWIANSTYQTAIQTMGIASGTIYSGQWTAGYDTTLLADGFYNITINATDFAGNNNITDNHQNFTMLVDNTKPNASVIAPLNGSNLTGMFVVNASLNDSASQVLNSTFRLINAVTATAWATATMGAGTATAGWWNATFNSGSLADGLYNLTINATDYAGNMQLLNISAIMIDNTKPNASIASPVNGTALSGAFPINASVNDTTALQYVSFSLSNSVNNVTEWMASTKGAGTAIAGYWNLTFDSTILPDDNYNITINATDFTGNQRITNISAVIIDNSPPNISFIPNTPDNNSFLNQTWLFVNVTINETTEKNVTFTLANNTFTNMTPKLRGNRTINFTGLADGAYSYNVTVLDNVSFTTSTETRIVTLDNRKPGITLLTPPNNTEVTANNVVTFAYNVTDTSPILNCSLILNSLVKKTSTLPDRNVSQQFVQSVANGIYNWSVNCTDLAGNTNSSERRNISVDVPVPSRTYYESNATTGSGTGATGQAINLSLDIDANMHTVSLSGLGTGELGTFVNATIMNRSEYGRNGILILTGSIISFEGWFDASFAGAGNPVWNLTKENSSGSYGICSVQSATGFPKNNPTLFSESCVSPNYNFWIKMDENLSLQVKTSTMSAGKTQNHYYGGGRDGLVSFNSYKLGDVQANISAPLTGISLNETKLFNATCNVSCTGENCLNTRLSVQLNTSSTGWLDINSTSGNIVLDGAQANPKIVGLTNATTRQFNFTLVANTPSDNKLRCAAVSDYSSINGTITLGVKINETTDLEITAVDIVLLNSSLVTEGQNITINATVRNRGEGPAGQFAVKFSEIREDGNRSISNQALQGLAGESYITLNTTFIAKAGWNNLSVEVNKSNPINETNESNNRAEFKFPVDAYSYYFGNSTTLVVLSAAGNMSLQSWEYNSTGNILAADSDAIIDFTALQALGRKIDNTPSPSDFLEADNSLNMTNFTDSIRALYTTDGSTPLKAVAMTVFGRQLQNVPVTNSTNSTNFETGILWDASRDTSGNQRYDGQDKEPLAFVTSAGLPKQGKYGYYNYEIRVPANLRSYTQPNSQNSITFYAELT